MGYIVRELERRDKISSRLEGQGRANRSNGRHYLGCVSGDIDAASGDEMLQGTPPRTKRDVRTGLLAFLWRLAMQPGGSRLEHEED